MILPPLDKIKSAFLTYLLNFLLMLVLRVGIVYLLDAVAFSIHHVLFDF